MLNHNISIFHKLLICMLFSSMFLSSYTFAHVVNENETKQKITNYLEKLEKVGFNGAVLVELSGKKLLSKGFGFSDKAKNLKINPNTVFLIGSITKQFTAAAILKLESDGKLSTDDPISKYFDSVPKDKINITIHDLLRHQSGLVSNVGGDYEPITKNHFVDEVFNSKLQFPPGEKFSYSNIGYSLLALIIEKTSNSSYEEYLQNNFFKKVGMKLTGYSAPEFKSADVALGYQENFKSWGNPTEKEWNGPEPYIHLLGNGGILSNVEDLYKWHKALLEFQVLSELSTYKLYHPRLRPEENENPYYAYGWDIFKTTRGTVQTWHNGTNGVFYADFLRLVDEGIAVIFMSNKADPIFNDISRNIVKLITEQDFIPQIPIPKSPENIKLTDSIIEALQNNKLIDAKNIYLNRKNTAEMIEPMLNQKGYNLLSENKIATAIEMFKFNTYVFPKSANAYDSLGEAYYLKKDFQKSFDNYQKSIELDPGNSNAKRMIDELSSK